MPYTVLDHTADTGIEATSRSLDELIADLANGMFELMAIVEECPPETAIELETSAPVDEDLVFEVLSDLLYESEVEDLLLCRIQVTSVGSDRVRVTASGVPNAEIDIAGPPIKAVTYHDIEVRQTSSGWYGRVYFDV